MQGYRRIAARFADEIGSRRLSPGAKVISVRSLAAREGVSVPTALAAFRVLEAEGILVAKPRSGWYVSERLPSCSSLSPASRDAHAVTTGDIARELFSLRSRGLAPFGAGLPQASWLPGDELSRSLSLTMRRLGAGAHAFSYPPGDPQLRARLASRLAVRGAMLGADDLIITSGATQAVELALGAVTSPGDTVGVESPCYFGTLLLLERLELRALELPTRPETGLDVDGVAAMVERIRPAAIVATAVLQNPTGGSMPREERPRFVRMLAERGVALIEDDTYGELGTNADPPFKAYDAEGSVLYCGSASKTLAPGWRIGWVAGGRHREALMGSRMGQSLAGSRLIEESLAAYLAGGAYDRHLARLRGRIRGAARAMAGRVAAGFPKGTHLGPAQGGLVLWVQLPAGTDSIEVMRRAAAAAIAVAPGPVFSASGAFSNFIRLNIANEPRPALFSALDRLGRICSDLAPPRSQRA